MASQKRSQVILKGDPSKLSTYLMKEKWTLLAITITGIFYNIGMTAGPWFEGQLAQTLCDIIGGTKLVQDMIKLAVTYVLVILFVQFMRFLKRLTVRRFANNLSRNMKETLYRTLVYSTRSQLDGENAGSLMTKAISDVDACVEGIRKFTTEVFDTGVVMVAYFVMLVRYDWRLTIISLLFPPIAYILAERLKKVVTDTASAARKSASALSSATLDRVSNAQTYRIYGQDINRNEIYEKSLQDYETKTIKSQLWTGTLQPIYNIISMIGAVFILWLGGRNVAGIGWTVWNIAAFSTFLSCFTKLSVKSSKAAKLFNAVQKATVSWKRIHPFLKSVPERDDPAVDAPNALEVRNVSFAYPGSEPVYRNISFDAAPGQIIGITGEVACGKSTLGKTFLCEYPYEGSIRYNGVELSDLAAKDCSLVGYLGHDPELFSASIKDNILLGDGGDIDSVLKTVCMDREVASFEEKENTMIGDGGVRLSGGQQARIALARTLFHAYPVLVLDDPFSAVDQKTELTILENLRSKYSDRIILLISHRLTIFKSLDGVVFMENGTAAFLTHDELMKTNEKYRLLVEMQTKGGDLDEQ